jgi:hypothetical protein
MPLQPSAPVDFRLPTGLGFSLTSAAVCFRTDLRFTEGCAELEVEKLSCFVLLIEGFGSLAGSEPSCLASLSVGFEFETLKLKLLRTRISIGLGLEKETEYSVGRAGFDVMAPAGSADR